MGLLNTQPMPWTPQGLSDTLDATNTPTGLMASLSNLVPDQTTRGVWVCRPAAALTGDFTAFDSASNDAFCKVMLHMDGADATTVFTDVNAGGTAKTWTTVAPAQIDTAQSKFGGASGLFDGLTAVVTTPDAADLHLGSGDFTVDLWFNCNVAAGVAGRIIGQSDAALTGASRTFGIVKTVGDVISGHVFIGGVQINAIGTTVFTNVTNTGWHHAALVRTGSLLKLFIDGVQEASSACVGTVQTSASKIGVGTLGEAVASLWNGWVDEVRISVGVARWTANFTPPASAYATAPIAGTVSVLYVIGSRVYGLIGTAAFAGHDQPFCFDTSTSAFVPVGGYTSANTPLTQASTGAWTPPRAALVGTKIVFTHPGFAGTGNKIGFIDVSVLAAPVWSAGDTAPQALANVPVDVFNFNGRAYYAVNTATSTAVQYSDVLTPQTITNANQVLTLDDTVPVTALGGVPLMSTNIGGNVQSLIIFKGVTSMYQILGDAATGTLARNKLSVPTGTLAANSVCPTPMGLAFVSPEGLRLVEPDGSITTPIGVDGQGVAVPFQYAVVPSRIAAACNGNTIRISAQNGYIGTQPSQEFWFDLARKNWSGPHTFAASLIAALGSAFVKTAVGVNAKLFTSDVRQSSTSGYVENGTQLTWSWATPLLPDLGQMSEMAIIESTVDMQYPAGVPSFLGIAYDQNGTLYDTVFLAPGGIATFWGGFLWGAAVWFGTPNALISRPLNWHKTLVFRRIAFGASGQSAGDFKIGTLRLRIEALGYLQQTAGS